MMRWLYFLLLIPCSIDAQNTVPPIGLWREHLSYLNALDVTASGNRIFCATPYSLFTIDLTTKEVQRISKVSGLSETGISTIKYDAASAKLFVAYTNSNVDILEAGKIRNIPDISRSGIPGDKTIYHIYPRDSRCYLSTGLGIIVLDAAKYEVKETWFIGNNGGAVKTSGFVEFGNYFYAATDEGLKKTSASLNGPIDFRNWQTVSGANGLSAAPAKAVTDLQGSLVLLQNDSLFKESGGKWNLFFANGLPVHSINVSGNKLFVCQAVGTAAARVTILNTNGSVETVLQQPSVIAFPKNAINVNGTYWVADLYAGLSQWTGQQFEIYRLNSPQNINTGEMAITNDMVVAAAGSVNSSWNYQYNPNGVYRLQDGAWTNFNLYNYRQLDSLLDFVTVAIDPRDAGFWAGSFGGGLIHIGNNDQITIYKQNSPLSPPAGDPGSYRVSGLAFDSNNNLWVSNFGSSKQLHVLKSNGTWQSFAVPFFLNENATAQIVIDDAGQKWIASPLGNGLLVFDQGSFDNPGDDKWKLYRMGTGRGNLPSSEVLSLAKDKNGFIWVGTTDGIGVIQCPESALTNDGCEGTLPVIREGNFTNYLFKGQEVRSIAVDGANRKWVATSSGAWLITAEGDKVLANFTEDNSPLLSNDVKKIAINGSTGEIFFATSAGLSSYMGSATEAGVTKNKVIVFPNPVPPSYSGTIGIRGLPENGLVKITELNGRLVYQSRALGGQAIWNGKDYKGSKASSGVYLVIAVNEYKQETVVAKIVLVN